MQVPAPQIVGNGEHNSHLREMKSRSCGMQALERNMNEMDSVPRWLVSW